MCDPINCTEEVMEKCKYSTANYARRFHYKDRRICEYIIKTGRKRPCPPTACTVFEEKGNV